MLDDDPALDDPALDDPPLDDPPLDDPVEEEEGGSPEAPHPTVRAMVATQRVIRQELKARMAHW